MLASLDPAEVEFDADRRIYVCVNVDCRLRGSEAVLSRLEELADERGEDIEIRKYICFAACEQGPNVLVEHMRTFYSGVQESDAEEVLEHAAGGRPVDRINQSHSFVAKQIFNLIDAGLRPGDFEL
jgi:(2Fe-2S) ferredoxin